MKRILPLILLSMLFLCTPVVSASPSMEITLSPEPQFNQIWAYETYLVNITIQGFDYSQIDFTGYPGTPTQLLYEGIITWKAKGGFDFGHASTGYNFNLDDLPVLVTSSFDSPLALFNLSLENDAFDYGIKPYEKVEVTINIKAYIQMSDDAKGPLVASKSKTWYMVDDTKVSYLEGKLIDMSDEILAATGASKLNSLNREKYLGILEDMNSSLIQGNYIAAQDTWKDYDDDERTNLILSLVRASDLQSDELDRLEEMETQLTIAESDLEVLQNEYDALENTYVALSNTYHKVNADLDVAKRNLSTAITAVFLSSILFYFLGQRGLIRRES